MVINIQGQVSKSMQIESFPPFFKTLGLAANDHFAQCIQSLYRDGLIDSDRWSVQCIDQRMWVLFHPTETDMLTQGWKLHVSADESSAEAVLCRVLPVLLKDFTIFKFASSMEKLALMNQGLAGGSQIGKFITIYPGSDEEAVVIAGKLDVILHGLAGPSIVSDRMLRPDSLIFYRYGEHNSKAYVQDITGRVWPAIYTLDNQLIPDKRTLRYQPPPQRNDPFLASGVATDLPKTPRMLAERYAIVRVISSSIRHTISLAVDIEKHRTCIVKSPGRRWQNTLPERMREPFRREARALQALGSHPRIPAFFDLIEEESNIHLIMSDIPGELLMERLNKGLDLVSIRQIITWAIDLAEVLDAIHDRGFVYADLKPTNIIIGQDEKLYLIDFELADRQDAPGRAKNGTRGYMSPQQYEGQPRCIADDVYSFGSLLYHLVTAAESSYAPDPAALLARPIEILRPDVPPALRDIIVRCLQPHPDARYARMGDVIDALQAIDEKDYQGISWNEDTSLNSGMPESRAREIALALLDTLCATAQQPESGEGLTWKTCHPIANGYALRDVNIGHAGTLLALAGLVAGLNVPGAHSILAQGADALRAMLPHSDPPLPGLYVGEAGVGAAFLLAGQVLEDDALIALAVERSRCISRLPHISPDVMHGTAGRLLFHLLVWDETQEPEHLSAALACGEHLIQTAQIRELGEICWTLPAAFEGFSQSAYPGYAHGVAGIADALLDLFEVAGDERLIPIIQGAVRWLRRLAIPTLADQSGLNWPVTEDKNVSSYASWCHGSTGIGRFFLHASRYTWLPGAIDMATCAAKTVTRLTKSGGPTLCHGLAGSIEFLLDMYQETHNASYLAEAQTFGQILEAFATKDEAGHLVFYSDQLDLFSPDYQVGYAGIAISFLRLSAPDRIPAQLSRAGFRWYKQHVKAAR
jgi:serine/threonine protein kinase